MSFSFNSGNNIPQIKAQATYKDGGGMGGGGMYFKQGKRKDQPDEDMFEYKEESPDSVFGDNDIKAEDIPADSLFNKFVNWFRPQG